MARFYIIFMTALRSQWNSSDTKRGFVGAKVFYMEHILATSRTLHPVNQLAVPEDESGDKT